MTYSNSLFRRVREIFIALLLISFGIATPSLANQGGGDAPDVNFFPQQKAKPAESGGPSFLKRLFRTGTDAKPAATKARGKAPRKARRIVRRESAPSGLPPAGELRLVNDQVIVRYRLIARQANMDALVDRLNLRHIQGRSFALPGVTAHLYQITDGTPVREIIVALENDPTVVSAQPNYVYAEMQATAAGNPSAQYALAKLAIAEAHALAMGDGVAVAVIDSQIDVSHAEFKGTVIDALDATDGAAGDPHAHGTSIAGIIASRGTLLGIAPGVHLIGIRAFVPSEKGASARSTTWRIATALDQAHKAGARIVNMSFAGPQDPLVGNSIAGGVANGMIGVAAAGNDGPDANPPYPAAYPGVIAVTAVDKDDAIYNHANRGEYIALAAPGVDILAPVPGNSYGVTSGTSLAAAHISGLAALLIGMVPDLSAEELTTILSSSANDLGEPGRDAVFGSGLPDAVSAINASAKNMN